MLPVEQKWFFYLVAGGIFLLILSQVRKRRLRENYTLLWLFISLTLVVIIYKYDVLVKIALLLKANPTSLLMFCGMVALLLLTLQLSLMVSGQAICLKNLAQKVALLEERLRRALKDKR